MATSAVLLASEFCFYFFNWFVLFWGTDHCHPCCVGSVQSATENVYTRRCHGVVEERYNRAPMMRAMTRAVSKVEGWI